jgi:AraC family transcriptional regulator
MKRCNAPPPGADLEEAARDAVVRSSAARRWDGIAALHLHFDGPTTVGAAPLASHIIALPRRAALLGLRAAGAKDVVPIGPGDIAILPAGIPAEWRWSGRALIPVDHLALAPAVLRDAAADLGLDPERTRLATGIARDPAIEQLGLALIRESMTGGIGHKLHAESLATALAVLLLRHHTTPTRMMAPARRIGRHPSGVPAALAHIEAHLAGELALADLAAVAGVSPFHFARLFRRETGRSPHQYVIERRVARAEGFLLAGDGRTVAEIATAVGFADHSHLTRHFRRRFGLTPRQLRDERTNGSPEHTSQQDTD